MPQKWCKIVKQFCRNVAPYLKREWTGIILRASKLTRFIDFVCFLCDKIFQSFSQFEDWISRTTCKITSSCTTFWIEKKCSEDLSTSIFGPELVNFPCHFIFWDSYPDHILEWLCRLFLYNLLSCLYFRLLFVYNLKSGTFWLLNNQGPIVLTHAQNFWVLTCTHTTYLFILWEFLIVYLCLYYLSPAAAPITIWIKMLVIYLFLDEKEKNNKNQHQFLLRHFYQKLHLQETQTMQVFVNITIWI